MKYTSFRQCVHTYIPYCEKYQSNADQNRQNESENFEGHFAWHLSSRPGHKANVARSRSCNLTSSPGIFFPWRAGIFNRLKCNLSDYRLCLAVCAIHSFRRKTFGGTPLKLPFHLHKISKSILLFSCLSRSCAFIAPASSKFCFTSTNKIASLERLLHL